MSRQYYKVSTVPKHRKQFYDVSLVTLEMKIDIQ